MRSLVFFILAINILSLPSANAANKETGSAKAISKLQMMVKEATTERDKLKADNAKIAAELEDAKKQLEQEKSANASLGDKLNTEVAAQKMAVDETRGRLETTTAKLREVVDKYNALNKAKNELAVEHGNLQNTQQSVSAELKSCESKNMKMFEASKEIIAGYQACQNKGFVDTLLDSEPVLKINNVEFETIIQEYEDKLNKQKVISKPKK